jgi:VanZ family protein
MVNEPATRRLILFLDIQSINHIYMAVRRTFIIYHLPVILYAGLIFLGSSLPQSQIHIPFSIKDKVLHFIEYGIMGYLLMRSAIRWSDNMRAMTLILLVILAGSVYAASDEIHQYFVPGRSCDIYDWLADVMGLVSGITIPFIIGLKKGIIKTGF